ncbi:hypothetical protein RhiJN_06738 [Ceratobasidium sp. AG-Ba]|nr:hypothetical protein RhiJN_06738 [Ceratobasidium sp. AG-Ba]
MSVKRKKLDLRPSDRAIRPTSRASQAIRILDLFTQPEESQLLRACAMIYSTVANHGHASSNSGATSHPDSYPVEYGDNQNQPEGYPGYDDQTDENRASKKQVVQWGNPSNNQNTLSITTSTSNQGINPIDAFYQSIHSGAQIKTGTESWSPSNLNDTNQLASNNSTDLLSGQGISLPSLPNQPTISGDRFLPQSGQASYTFTTGVSSAPVSSHDVSYQHSLYAPTHTNPTMTDALGPAVTDSDSAEMANFVNMDPQDFTVPPTPTRTGRQWVDDEKDTIIRYVSGENRKVNCEDLASGTSRHVSSVALNAGWTGLIDMFDNSRSATAIVREFWTLIDTYHDICNLTQFICSQDGNSAAKAGVVPVSFKSAEVVAWQTNGWIDMFDKQGVRTHGATERSRVGLPAAPAAPASPAGSLSRAVRRKRSGQSVVSSSLSASSFPNPSAVKRASSSKPIARLPAPASNVASFGVTRPVAALANADLSAACAATLSPIAAPIPLYNTRRATDSGNGSIPQSSVGQRAPNSASLAELVRQNNQLIKLLTKIVDSKEEYMRIARESEVSQRNRENIECALASLKMLVELEREERKEVRELTCKMMYNEKTPEQARRQCEQYILGLHKPDSPNTFNLASLQQRLENLIQNSGGSSATN